jgi:hypothetical protein
MDLSRTLHDKPLGDQLFLVNKVVNKKEHLEVGLEVEEKENKRFCLYLVFRQHIVHE